MWRADPTNTSPGSDARHPRRGFTLVEVLIAVLLLNIGLLALVASSAVLVRQTTLLRARAIALQTATNRLEWLAAGACIATTGTAAGSIGLLETWSARPIAGGARELRDSVTFTVQGRTFSVSLETRQTC
jgi:prepilin-type N-terminal cleavage/methylation domain-containing protein